MKKRWGFLSVLAVLICAALLLPCPARAETTLGFARLAMSANVRSGVTVKGYLDPGNTSYRLPEGAMVYIWDVQQDKEGETWYHITCQYNDGGKLRGRQGWIVSSCVDPEPLFTDVAAVSADENGFVALRRDGTVTGAARLTGDTAGFYASLEKLRDVAAVSACADGYLFVNKDGTESVIGKVPRVEGDISNVVMDAMQEERTVITAGGMLSTRNWHWAYPAQGADLGRVVMMEQKQGSVFMLMDDGTVACAALNDDDRFMIMPEELPDFSKWTDIVSIDTVLWHPQDVYFYEVFAGVRKDGTVRISPRVIERYTLDWKDVKQVSLAADYLVGVTNSGTVYAAGRSEKIIEEVSSWTGIEAVCAADGYCVGVKTDGSLVFAGKFSYGYVEPKQ